jgi:hypothetical protein
MTTHRNLFQRWPSFLLAIIGMCIGMGLAAASAWYQAPKQGKVFRKYLPVLPEPVQLLEIKTANQTIRFPDELHTLTSLAVRRGEAFAKDEVWSLEKPDEALLKQSPIFKVKDISRRPYIEIEAGKANDWLKGAAFKLKNLSGKAITYIELSLDFPETQSSGTEMSFRNTLGRRSGINTPAEPLFIMPGDEFSVTIDEGRYEGLTKFIEKRHPISDINVARVRIGFLIFEDNTGWAGGEYYRPDPNNPTTYLPVGPKPPNN